MKKYFSLIAFAMMAVFCLSFVSCGGDDDDEFDEGGAYSFSFTRDGKRYDVENVDWINPLFGHENYKKGNYFCLEFYQMAGQIHIIFPYSQYGKNVQPSFFKVGYSDFGEDATDIEYYGQFDTWYGEYVSGSAKVIKNSGKSITVQFINYTFEVGWYGNDKTHEFILNGTLEFKCYMYE